MFLLLACERPLAIECGKFFVLAFSITTFETLIFLRLFVDSRTCIVKECV